MLDVADRFRAIREQVIGRLMQEAAFDPAFAGLTAEEIESQITQLLSELERYVVHRHTASYRSFVRRYVALRSGSGILHETLIPSLVRVGDSVLECLQEAGANDPRGHELLLSVSRANFQTARVIVEMLADEHRRRLDQLGQESR